MLIFGFALYQLLSVLQLQMKYNKTTVVFYNIIWNLEFEVNCCLRPEFEVVWIDTAKANSI